MERTFGIAIIGGGFSGTMLAVQLLKQNHEVPLKIYLIEKNLRAGAGTAYSTDKPFHLLNVRAEKMSAFPDEPNHFINWLQEKNIELSPSEHMPRKIYGDYIRDILKTYTNNKSSLHSIENVYDEAVDIEVKDGSAYIHLKNINRPLHCDKAILALGNFPPSTLPFSRSIEKKYCGDPWNCDYMGRIRSTDNVLIIGTGLTMIDTCMNLYKARHKGKIYGISHHGYLPVVHNYTQPYPSFYKEMEKSTTVLELVRTVRKHITYAINTGNDWRSVIDSLRPHTQHLWLNLTQKEKEKFLKNLNRIWSVIRHRIPPEYYEVINKLQLSNQLEIIAGKIVNVKSSTGNISFEILKKKRNVSEHLSVDFVINCTGPQNNYTKIDYPLIKNLLAKKLIQPGPFNLGIDADTDGKIKGNNEELLYTLGPPLTGVLFESTAVPELREQARNLAAVLLAELKKNLQKV